MQSQCSHAYDACAEYDGLIERIKNLLREWAVDTTISSSSRPALPPSTKIHSRWTETLRKHIFFEDVSAVIESGLGKMNASNKSVS